MATPALSSNDHALRQRCAHLTRSFLTTADTHKTDEIALFDDSCALRQRSLSPAVLLTPATLALSGNAALSFQNCF